MEGAGAREEARRVEERRGPEDSFALSQAEPGRKGRSGPMEGDGRRLPSGQLPQKKGRALRERPKDELFHAREKTRKRLRLKNCCRSSGRFS